MLLFALATLGTAGATEIGRNRDFGLGVQLGTFSGLSGKYYLGRGRENALSFGLGTGYGSSFYNSFHAHVTYSQHFAPLASGDGVTIPWRIGIGGFVNSGNYFVFDDYVDDGFLLGARAPIGLDFDLEDVPVQIFVEVAIDLLIFPGIAPGLDAGLGFRYYF